MCAGGSIFHRSGNAKWWLVKNAPLARQEKCKPLVGKGRHAQTPDWNCYKMRTYIHSPWDGERGDIVRGGISQEAVWLFTRCILILQDGGSDKWKPANAPARILLLFLLRRDKPENYELPGLIWKISVYSVNARGLYPPKCYILQNVISSQMLYPAHCRKNVPLHLALQPRKILFYKIAPSQMTVNKIILNYLQFQIIFFVLKSQFQMLVHPLRDVVIEGSDWGLTR